MIEVAALRGPELRRGLLVLVGRLVEILDGQPMVGPCVGQHRWGHATTQWMGLRGWRYKREWGGELRPCP